MWDHKKRGLVHHQHLPSNASDYSYFAGKSSGLHIVDSGFFFAVAITKKSTSYATNSLVFKWDPFHLKFKLLQEVATSAAMAVTSFTHQKDSVLLFANMFDLEKDLYLPDSAFTLLGGNEPTRFLINL